MVNGVTTGHLWDGTNIVAEMCRDALGNEVYRYGFLYDTSGNLLVRKKTNADGSVCSNCVLWGISPHGGYSPAGMTVPESGNNPLCAGFMHNVHGDVVRVWVMTSISSSYVYDAYGDILEENIEFDWFSNPFRYAGYYYDTETGLYYLKNRYYNGYSTRFMTEDPYWNVSNMLYGKFTSAVERRVYYPTVVQSGNRYVYCGGNPVRFYDPSGLLSLSDVGDFVVDAIHSTVDTVTEIASTVTHYENEAQKEMQRAVWRTGAEFYLRRYHGYETSAYMLEHSLQSNPEDLYRDNDSRIAYLINHDNEYLSALDSAIRAESGSTIRVDLKDIVFDTGDLYYSIHCADIHIEGYQQDDGSWMIHATLIDIYDFTEIQSFMSDDKFSFSATLGTVANDVAFFSQKLGAIQPYGVVVDFFTTWEPES